MKAELFGPLGSERYRGYAADISASAAELRNMLAPVQTDNSEPAAQFLRTARNPARFDGARAAAPERSSRRERSAGASAGELIGSIYDAVTEPDTWGGIVERLAALLGADLCSLLSYDRRRNRLTIVYMATALCVGMPDGFGDLRSPDDLMDLNADVAKERLLLESGRVRTDKIIGGPGKPNSGAGGRDGENDVAGLRYRMIGLIDRTDAEVSFISALRFPGRGPFASADSGLLEQLLPHARRAMDVRRRVCEAESEREALAAGFGHISFAAIFVGSDGRPLYFNGKAGDLFQKADGLVLGNDGLCGATSRETGALRAAIENAAAAGNGEHAGALSLSRPSGRKPFSVLVVPVPGKSIVGLGRAPGPAVVVFVTDPESGHHVNRDALRQFWQLTQNEARVASMIALGQGVDQIAAEMQITANTVRTHLKHIFEKTQTTGQVDLVHLIMSSPAVLQKDA